MPTTVRYSIGVTSVQSAKPNNAYGSNLQQAPLDSGAALALLRANIPVDIPKNAVVTSAKIWVNQYDGPWTGAVTLTALRHLASYTYKVTWNTKPAATTSGSTTKTGVAKATWWGIDVKADVQGFIAGTRRNYGWRLATSSTTLHKIRTHLAAASKPYLEIVYEVPSKIPTDLAPQGGSVDIDKPILTFSVADGTTAIQVQIDPDADATSPAFDTGELDGVTAGVLDLADTSYPGLADGESTYWRARTLSAGGWSAYSPWVQFAHDDLGTVELTSPIATPADVTPPFEWTFSGTQTSWEADFLDANGKVLDTSGHVGGTETAWTPKKGLKASGDTGTARIRVYDDVVRIATPGRPIYAEATVDITVTLDGTVDPLDSLSAAQDPHVPGVNLTGARAGGVPDEIVVFRNDQLVARMPGTDAFTGTAFAWTDWTAPMNAEATYRVAPVVNNAVASGGPTVTLTPKCTGYWLVDPATGDKVLILDVGPSGDQTDIATVHQPTGDNEPTVRRRLRRGVYSGSVSGALIDALGFSALDAIELMDVTFPENDASTIYRLIEGHRNIPVIAGDFLVVPTQETGPRETIARCSFNFWGQ